MLVAMAVVWFSGLPVDELFVEKYGKAVELLSKEVLAPLSVELFCPDPNVKREPLINNKVSQRILAIIMIEVCTIAANLYSSATAVSLGTTLVIGRTARGLQRGSSIRKLT